jgi:hypothetical protein
MTWAIRVTVWSFAVLTGGLALAVEPAVSGPTTAPTPQELNEKIQQLQQQVDQLKAAQSQAAPVTRPAGQSSPGNAGFNPGADFDPMQQTSAPPVPATENLPSISPVVGGWDGSQFIFRSQDGNFSFHPGLVVDFRNDTSYRASVPAKGGGSEVGIGGYDTQNGFDVARLRLLADGTLFHQVSYFIQFQDDQGSTFNVYDANLSYKFDDSPFSIKVGQFKDPVWHERNVSEANLMAVDRTLVEYYLGGGQGSRVQGAALNYDAGRFRGQLVAHDGDNSINTKFFNLGGVAGGVGGFSGVTPTDYGFSGRSELMLIGDRTKEFNPFNEYDQFTSYKARQSILVIGGGADYSQGGSNDLLLHSVDLQYNNPDGFAAYAAYLGTYRNIKTNQGVAPGHYYDEGFVVQASWVFGKFEPFARYDWTHFDPSSTTAVTALRSHVLQEVTVGANYYLYGQKLKLTADASLLPDGSPGDSDVLGVLKDSGHTEFVARFQVQLAI